ncbi:hypothetical protein [Pontiella sulfatireligans]|uniref:Helicase XPB/Ssl2 N-terminal domain-containing protein n=1 Tax=Pontiella sulfatireligans TaxID=2750658 RepID=A0A6C2UTL2_9BACT|nr:hypothetical protein [Pontiella sulfatireligans]VGO22557.1 hypothetical protein SCARR_04641 [Pontiella sulfatireligans]
MELHYSNKNAFSKPLDEVLVKFYTAEELWGIACQQVYPALQQTRPDKREKKAELIEKLNEVFVSEETMQRLFKAMPPDLYAVIELLAWGGDHWAEKVEKQLGVEVLNRKTLARKRHYDRERIEITRKPEMWWVVADHESEKYYSSDRRTALRLPPAVRSLFRKHMPKPAGYNLEPFDAPPEGTRTFRCDETLGEDLRVVADYIDRGHLEYTKNEAIKKPCIRALARLTGGGEFFPAEKSSAKLPLLRHELLVNIVASTGSSLRQAMLEDPPDPARMLRPLATELFKHPDWFFEYVLTHLSGSPYSCDKAATARLKAVFAALSVDQWVSFENLENYVNYREIDVDPAPRHRCQVSIEPIRKDYYSIGRIDVDSTNGWLLVVVPMVQGSAFLLAALGLAEIAYALPRHPGWQRKSEVFLTPYDGLAAVRLTPLGAYALGQTDEVELKASQRQRAEILLNPQRLTAICRHIDPITEMSLLEFMEKISDGCYRMTRQTLMRGCSSGGDVQKRIEKFKAQIVRNLPEFWEQFLEDTKKSAVALTPKTRYTVYELADNPELRRLFLSDAVLREKALKVEGTRVAIEKADAASIARRLAALGYLMR